MTNRFNSSNPIAVPAFFAATILVTIISLFLALPHGASADTPAEINTKIEAISEKEHQLELRINKLQGNQNVAEADLAKKAARQHQLQTELTTAKAKAVRLTKRLDYAKKMLAKRIVTVYKEGEPDIITVVLQSKGFSQMVQRATYLRRVSDQDQFTINRVGELKKTNKAAAIKLASLEQRQVQLVAEVAGERDTIAAKKGHAIAQRGGLKSEIAKQRKLLRAASAALNVQPEPQTVAFKPIKGAGGGGRVTLNSDGSASAPANAPSMIKAAVAAGNQIRSTPYIWGGGHGSFSDRGYDCSGSVSYVLHAAGVLSSPEASGPLMSWGTGGPGNWITVYANEGHVWMTVGGLRFDTSGRSGTGSRWQTGMDAGGGFTVRHYPGL